LVSQASGEGGGSEEDFGSDAGGRVLLKEAGAGLNTVDCLAHLARTNDRNNPTSKPETFEMLAVEVKKVHAQWLAARKAMGEVLLVGSPLSLLEDHATGWNGLPLAPGPLPANEAGRLLWEVIERAHTNGSRRATGSINGLRSEVDVGPYNPPAPAKPHTLDLANVPVILRRLVRAVTRASTPQHSLRAPSPVEPLVQNPDGSNHAADALSAAADRGDAGSRVESPLPLGLLPYPSSRERSAETDG
jgi:hypothetical protein